MQIQGEGLRVSIYIGESNHYRGQTLYMALLELLKRSGAAGATVTRGIAGFGAHSRIHTAGIEALSTDLPVKLEWIDRPDRVERLLPAIRHMVADGLITVEKVEVVQYAVGRNQDPLEQPVGDIMNKEVLTVQPDTPLAQVVSLLLDRGYRSLPVVDKFGRPVGIITDGDLLRHAHLTARLGLQGDLAAAQLRQELANLQAEATTADTIMTRPVITVHTGDKVRTAVARMAKHGLKRLPVVDDHGRLAGLISRLDVFRTVEYHQAGQPEGVEPPLAGKTVQELMHGDVPTVGPQAQLEEIVQALEQSQRRRVVVVDDGRHVLGIITDGDLLRRSQQGQSPGLLSRLRSLVTGQEEIAVALPDEGESAASLMTAPAITVRTDTPPGEALRLMIEHAIKRLPVVDQEGRLVGLLGRASLLHGLLENQPAG